MASGAHLAKRFFGSLIPLPPRRADVTWSSSQLLPGEAVLWRSMPRADRRHSIAVARRVEHQLGVDATRPVLAAALLHDVGKTASGLGTMGRVGATLVAGAAGRERAGGWGDRSGPAGRIGRYVRHPQAGAALLESAGSDDLTVAWAREHHLPPDRWTIEPTVAHALRAADDD